MTEAKALLRLQELDLEYSRLKHNAETLPQKDKIAATRAAAKKVASEINKIVGERKDLETEINDIEVHKKYITDKVTEVQNSDSTEFRGAQDMEASLSTLAKKLEKAQFQSDQLVERLEKVERAEKNARELSRRLATEEQDQTLAYKLALENIAKEVQAVTVERGEVAKQLSQETIDAYLAARKRFGGIAVETLEGNRPSACRVALQPSSYSDIRRSNADIVTCPYCRRMLVVDFDNE